MSTAGPFPVPEPYRDRPAMAVIIYLFLHDADRPLTAQEISEASGRPISSVRAATRELTADGLIEQCDDL